MTQYKAEYPEEQVIKFGNFGFHQVLNGLFIFSSVLNF